MTTPTLVEVLDFEAANPGPAGGRKATRIRDRFGITPTRYYQLLILYTNTPAALQHDPVTTHRVMADTAHRIRTRTERETQ